MKTVGIIAEYNPLHNGHAYQIAKAKELTGADYAVVVMSGNFVQRGQPAVMEKSLRTEAALLCGADIVLELPVHYAAASAEYFASGAVALLQKLGVVDVLCFGSECGDINRLSRLADALFTEDEAFKSILKSRLKKGISYPQARNDAFCTVFPQLSDELPLLKHPNNILGLEYLKALKKRNCPITPYTISRMGSGYHDENLGSPYSSALAIREAIAAGKPLYFVKEHVPPAVYELMTRHYEKNFPILPDDFSLLLSYKLLQEQDRDLRLYFDIDSGFSDRIRKFLPAYTDFTSFCEALKTKNVTYTKVSRSLLHILLNIKQTDMDAFCAQDYIYYARILGFRRGAAPLLSAMKKYTGIPLLSKLADARDLISSENGRRMLEQDIQAGHLYALAVRHKFHQDFQNEYQKRLVIL